MKGPKMVRNTLLNLGLTDKEIAVYLDLVQNEVATTSQIAKRIKLPRQTVYSIIEALVAREFVDQSDKRGVKHFFADPNKLLFLMDREKRRLDRHRITLEQEIPELIAMQHRGNTLPKVQYYDGVSGLKRLFNNILETFKGRKVKEFRGYGLNSYPEALNDFLRDFVMQRGQLGVQTHLFTGQTQDDFDHNHPYGREVKQLTIPSQQAGVYLAGDTAYFFSYKDSVGVMIENKAIVDLLKQVFDDHWQKSR